MKEIYKKVDFKYLDKEFLNQNNNLYYVSNTGKIRTDKKNVILTNRNNKRLIIRINYNNKRYEIGVASLVAICFIDNDFNKYDITFKDKNCLNCNKDNISLVYRHIFRVKSDYLIHLFNDYISTNKSKRIFYEMLSRKNIILKPYFDYEDLYQEFTLYLYEHLTLFNEEKHINILRFSLSIFNTWYGKYIRSKLKQERLNYEYLQEYQQAKDNYNSMYQIY